MAKLFTCRPLGLAGLGLLLLALVLALLGVQLTLLTLIVLAVVPGLAALPLLPDCAHEKPLAALAAVPAIAISITAIAVISISSLGVELTASALYAVLIAVTSGLLIAPLGNEPDWLPINYRSLLKGAALLAVLAIAFFLQGSVIERVPVPGNDWAKYLLYAQEIVRNGSLLINNHYWMLGMPFREDPGAPALYGSFLLLSGHSVGILAHGIWIFSLIAVLSMFAYVYSVWNFLTGLIAAAIFAVVPICLDILGWHGLANVLALALIPLLLLLTTVLLTQGLKSRQASVFALLLVALAAAHRLSFIVAVVIIVVAVVAALLTKARYKVLRGALLTAAFGLPLSAAVVYDLWQRNRSSGGTQNYTKYLTTKVELGPLVHSLTIYLSVASVLALFFLAWHLLRDRDYRLIPLLASAAVFAVFSYAWILHVPLVYFRMPYYFPLFIAPAVAILLTQTFSPRWAAAIGCALVAVIVISSANHAKFVRQFYGFANPISLRGLSMVAQHAKPDDVILTDRCWSFLATYFLKQPTLSALRPEDIGPPAEAHIAKLARKILAGIRGSHLGNNRRVRYILIDPRCVDAHGHSAPPPKIGSPIYASQRLLVLRVR